MKIQFSKFGAFFSRYANKDVKLPFLSRKIPNQSISELLVTLRKITLILIVTSIQDPVAATSVALVWAIISFLLHYSVGSYAVEILNRMNNITLLSLVTICI